MNAALEEFVTNHPSFRILDMRNIIHSSDDVTDNIRHYQRKKYVEMAQALSKILLGDNTDISQEHFIDSMRYVFKKIVMWLKK